MELLINILPGLMFAVLILGLFSSLPVSIVLFGVTLIFGTLAIALGEMRFVHATLLPNRIYGGIIENPVLVAAPMFIFMGVVMEKTRIAEDLLLTLQQVLRGVPGGLALAVMLMGTILAASTGIIGASVVMLTVLALPTMLEKGYSPSFASGTVASAGTLGILIPPSVMLVFMGDLLTLNLSKLFVAALLPGLLLAGVYLIFIIVKAWFDPKSAPVLSRSDLSAEKLPWSTIFVSVLIPILIIVAVLGSILGGIATPTEAAGVGAFSALLLGFIRGRLSLPVLGESMDGSVRTLAMLFFIFVGATAFSFVFRKIGGDAFIIENARALDLGDWGLLMVMMLIIFAMGFFFDWIEITLILLPIFAPVVQLMDFGDHIARADLVYWFAVLMAVNLQTSFLTPPFGPALFFLRGASNNLVSMGQVYRGVIPFVILQLVTLVMLLFFPDIAMWLPNKVLD